MQKLLEPYLLRLIAAWSDFQLVESAAKEVIRRFGQVESSDVQAAHWDKDPLFISLQATCVVGYTRPFANGLDLTTAGCREYAESDWQRLHEELMRYSLQRQFVVAHAWEGESSPERLVVIEAGPALEPLKDFAALRDMCADRKAMLWPVIEDAVAQSYPALDQPIVVSVISGGSANSSQAAIHVDEASCEPVYRRAPGTRA